MSNLRGFLFILLSAAAFGAMGLCATLAYADGVDTASLLTLRFIIAACLLGISVKVRKSNWPTGKAFQAYLIMGAVYATMAWSYFSALHYAASSTVALVLYIYPILVAVIAAILGLDHFGRSEFLAVTGSSLGLLLMLGTSLESSVTGFALALLAALCYASYIILGSKITDTASPIASSCLVLGSAGIIFSLLSAVNGFHIPHTTTAWAAVGFLAIFGTAMAIAAFVAGLSLVGPTMAAVLSTLEPVVTIVLGISFLNESLQPSSIAGGSLIICAAIGLTMVRMKRARAPASKTSDISKNGIEKNGTK